jgi:hypothetical protein
MKVWITVLCLRTWTRGLILRTQYNDLLFTRLSFTRFRFNAIEEHMPLPNLRCFSSHFNAIERSVTGNMADECVALKTTEATHINLLAAMV